MIAWLRTTRGLTVLLMASLGANLFLGGMVAGRIAGDVSQRSQTWRGIQAMLAPLSEAKRDLVRREINVAMPNIRQHLAALKKARAAVGEEMMKPAPDSGALERGFADVQKHTGAIRSELQQAMMRALPALTQQERHALVQALGRQRSGGALPFP